MPPAADAGDGLSRRLDEIAALIAGRPAGDPAVTEALAEAMRLLYTVEFRLPGGQSEQVTAFHEQLASRLPADHPVALLALLMSQALRFVQALAAGDPDRADALLSEMIRSAEAVPPGHPLRPFALSGVATAYVERHSLTGDLRNLELAKQAVDKALDATAETDGPFAPGGKLHGYLLYVRGHVLMVWNVYDPRLPRVNDAIEDLEQALAEAGPELAARYDMTTGLETAKVMRQNLVAPLGRGARWARWPVRPSGGLSTRPRPWGRAGPNTPSWRPRRRPGLPCRRSARATWRSLTAPWPCWPMRALSPTWCLVSGSR